MKSLLRSNVKVHNVTIETSLDAPLTDGIVPDGTGIALPLGGLPLLSSFRAALAFGSEMSGGILDIHVDHLWIHDSSKGPMMFPHVAQLVVNQMQTHTAD
ncbi:hypothetical protein ZEAMMB73_Zm00001d031519 [Zea mays]|uniref:Uncharacterized protein n=1 Tax=Zea mays TaxID=4577 RepID=A0A1D6KJC0_MAIZE|nr:hypothetical protein ZEAMMB73_Zm00001d031519 [Zea mays]